MRRKDIILIDGSHEEGGGAMLRTALAMSTATKLPFRMINIRTHRPSPGLKQQHITSIKALKEWTGAKAEGNIIGSQEVVFFPGNKQNKELNINAETAAPATLILQSIIPAVTKRTRIRIKGGTDVKWAPPIDYFTKVFSKAVNEIIDIKVTIQRRGYYPKGEGFVEIIAIPRKNKKELNINEKGRLLGIRGVSHASFMLEPKRVAERTSEAARILLKNRLKYDYPINIKVEYSDSASPGSGITLWAEYDRTVLGADALGKKGVIAEKIGEEAAEKLITLMSSEGAIDPWLADQIIPFLALHGGSAGIKAVTPHTISNIYVCEQFISKEFIIENDIIRINKL